MGFRNQEYMNSENFDQQPLFKNKKYRVSW